jgi:uncharacterized protein (DUF427 family)
VKAGTAATPFRHDFKEIVMANPAPGYAKYPKHRVAARPAGGRVVVKFGSDVIADTADAVALEETMEGHVLAPVVYYIPRKDVRMERLVRTSHHTDCPFKGKASYYSIRNGPENAVWTYEAPYDEMLAIRELLAFYPDKVEISA